MRKETRIRQILWLFPQVIFHMPGGHHVLNKNLTILIELVLPCHFKSFLQTFYTLSYKDVTEFDIKKVLFAFCFLVDSQLA